MPNQCDGCQYFDKGTNEIEQPDGSTLIQDKYFLCINPADGEDTGNVVAQCSNAETENKIITRDTVTAWIFEDTDPDYKPEYATLLQLSDVEPKNIIVGAKDVCPFFTAI